jgi:hypothetical protein
MYLLNDIMLRFISTVAAKAILFSLSVIDKSFSSKRGLENITKEGVTCH